MIPTCDEIQKEILLHEILGVTTSTNSFGPSVNLDNGSLWVYDSLRGKWFSSYRCYVSAGRKGRSKNIYLNVGGLHPSNLGGFQIFRDATITAVTAQTSSSASWTLRVRKNGSIVNIASLIMNNEIKKYSSVVNVDLTVGDSIEFFAETTNFLGVKDPIAWIEIAWRNTILATP